MSTLEDLPLLDGIDFATSEFDDSSWIVRPLQDFLPDNIVRFSSSSHHEHLFLAQFLKSKSRVMDRAEKFSEQTDKPFNASPFFRLPARVLEVEDWIPAIAANEPLKRNEVVQKVIIHDQLNLLSFPDEEPWHVPGNEWSERQTRDYRTAFANLRSLNDNFELQILLEWMEYQEFADDQDRLNALVNRLVPLSAQIAGHAKEAGFPDVEFFAVLRFMRQTTECKTYKRMLLATKQFLKDQPEFTCTAGMDAEKFKGALPVFIFSIADAWTITFGSHQVHFGFVGWE
ncbi:hypothetical protein M3Y99_01930100 [Aphelenchoides fujianensis]|nr:hypothetical protein M3Y99_01930100 [Aphelenchoides fujianensis]